jgi:acetylornithine deacetylase/succinyl-diaminopimelate desuccinylase-like protein
MASRDGALARALAHFDSGGFRDHLAELVAIPSTSQDPGHEADVQRYLADAIQPWLERMGFAVEIHPNPIRGFGPILFAERLEGPDHPTILSYGHGDTVRGLDDLWRAGLSPWTLTEEGERWYGRGSADNKGQHALNLAALEAVLAERGGSLGFNLKLVLETSEERGSTGLRQFVAEQADRLVADVLIASDGPRVMPEVPTIATGTRGIFNFDLVVNLRPGGVHSGHWGGLTTDPAVVLSHALGAIIDRRGKILVRDWPPPNGVPAAVRAVLDGCPVGGGGEAANIDPDRVNPALPLPRKSTAGTALSCCRCSLADRRTRSMRLPQVQRRTAKFATSWIAIPPCLNRHCVNTWTNKDFQRSASRTLACGCRQAAPIPATRGSAGPFVVWKSRWASGCR